MLLGEMAFLFVCSFMRSSQSTPPQPQPSLRYVAIAMLAILAPLGFGLRKAVYGKRDTAGNISPGKYGIGNILLWAMLDATTFFSLITFLLGDQLGMVLAGAAMGIHATTFPYGAPMGPLDDSLPSR